MRHAGILLCVLVLSAAVATGADESYLPAGKNYTWTYDLTMNSQVGALSVPQKGSATCVCTGPEKVGDLECWIYTWTEERRNKPKRQVKVWARSGADAVAVLRVTDADVDIVPVEFGKAEKRSAKVMLGESEVAVTSTVAGEEEIETPAGKFKCVKVVSESTTPATKASCTIWYAKGVGVVKVLRSADVAGAVKSEREMVLRKFDKGDEGDKGTGDKGDKGEKKGAEPK